MKNLKPKISAHQVNDETAPFSPDDFEKVRADGDTVALLTVSRIVRDHVQIKHGGHKSIGAVVDDMIADAIENDEQIEGFELTIPQHQWHDLCYHARQRVTK